MRKRALIFIALLALGLTGCVYVTHPVGEGPVVLEEKLWEGTWLSQADGWFDETVPVYTRIKDGEKGVLEMAGVDDDGDGFRLEVMEVQIYARGEWMLAYVDEKDEESELPENRYLFFRVKADGNQITIWSPDNDKFKELVEAGKLPGKILRYNDVVLGELEAEHLESAMSEGGDSLYEPFDILTRVN